MTNEMFGVSNEAVMYVNKDRLDAYIDGFTDGMKFATENKKNISPDSIALFCGKINDYLHELHSEVKEQGVFE